MPGPRHNLPVAVLDEGGRQVATATCFFAAFTDEDGTARWRGFLTFIEPAGSLGPGRFQLRPADGNPIAIQIREVRSGDKREQAVFAGLGSPPPIPEEADR